MDVIILSFGKITHTPVGLADVLCDEYELKLRIENTACTVFKDYGYRMVQIPTFEYFDVYNVTTPTQAEHMFKFFDNDGRMLALRPDLTTSVARMAATKPAAGKLPLRISYCGSAFRNEENFSQARQREFTQVGVELIGANSVNADAEIIQIAIETFLKSGIKNFQIDLGQVEFFKGLVEQAGLSDSESDLIRSHINDKDFIAVQSVLDNLNINSNMKSMFQNLATMFGGIEIVDKALCDNDLNQRSKDALKNLKDVYSILVEKDLDKYVSIDLGMVQNIDYYTGIIIRGFTYGVGFPICSGGRYDNLLAKFGRDIPATGIAIGVERVMASIYDENNDSDKEISSSEYVTVALAKGRLAELSVDIFEKIGFDVNQIKEKTRKLIFTDEENKLKFILVKASDVPTYVEYGAADIGIVGKDTLLENNKNLYEVLDLGFGKCKMAVAGPKEMKDRIDKQNIMRVASKYPRIAREYFHKVKGQTVDIIKLNGSVELGPLVGLSDVIVDIVESGKTLKENGLDVLEEICDLSARLVVNRVSMKLKRDKIVDIIQKMKGEINC